MTLRGIKKLILHPKIFFNDYSNKKNIIINSNDKKLVIGNVNLFEQFTHILHSGEGENGINHLNLWIPFFLEAQIDFLVITRHIITFNNVKKNYPFINVVYGKGNKEITEIVDKLVFVKAAFYPSNNGNNIDLLQYNNFKHIFIGHGDSDKLTSAHKRFRVYDENWVASDAHIDRFNNAGFDHTGLQHIKVGRPNLRESILLSDSNWENRFNGDINILYLPTWEGSSEEQNYSSFYFANDMFEKLNSLTSISKKSLKLHPATGIRLLKYKNMNKSIETFMYKKDIEHTIYIDDLVSDIIGNYNIFICDISAVVSEVLSLDAPIFVYIPQDKNIKLSQSKMKFEDYTYTFSSIEELIEKLKKVISGDDYLKENRLTAMEYILGKSDTKSNKFINQLLEINKKEILCS